MTKAKVAAPLLLFCVACSSSRETATRPTAIATVRSALSSTDYKSLVLRDGAVGYWRLGDTGQNAADSAPAGNGGTYLNSVPGSPIPNQNQPGALLNDSDPCAEFYILNNPGTTTNYVQIPANSNQSPPGASLSIEAWFTMTPGKIPQTYSVILHKNSGSILNGYGFYWYSNALYFYVNNRNVNVSVPLSAMGDTSTFHHVVGTYNGTVIKLYYDGTRVGSRPIAANEGQNQAVNAAPDAPLWIGKSPWVSVGWQGRIDEVAIYPGILDDGQVQAHFQAGRPPGPLSRAFVAYAQHSLTFGTSDHISGGDVGVAYLDAQSTGPQLVIGASSVFDTQRGVFAPSVSLGSQAQVGTISTNALTNNGGTLGSQQSFPGSMPVLPVVPSGAPGTMNITIASGRTQNLAAGSYGALTVNGTARLYPGAYSFSSINVGAGGIIYALPWIAPYGNVTIRVDNTLTTGAGSVIAQADNIAGALSIGVAGWDPGSSNPAVSIGTNNSLGAVLNAPNGTVSVGDGTYVNGAITGFAINVGNNVTMALNSGLTALPSAQTAADCVAAVQEMAFANRAPGSDAFNLGTEAALDRCRVPNLTPCQNKVLAQANFDRRAAAFQYVAQTLSTGQYLALTRDRSRKLHTLANDASALSAVCAGDADGDLVPDGVDQCPNTPPITPTTADGCTDSTIPPAPNRVLVDAMLQTMGIIRDASCNGAPLPATPGAFALCAVPDGGYRLWIKPSTNEPADCTLWYEVNAQLIRPDGTSSNVAITPQGGEFRASPDPGDPFVYLTMQPTDSGDRGAWAQASLAAAIVSVRAVNGNGNSSTWSSPVRLMRDAKADSLCADLEVNP